MPFHIWPTAALSVCEYSIFTYEKHKTCQTLLLQILSPEKSLWCFQHFILSIIKVNV